jgi:hypothetical protein
LVKFFERIVERCAEAGLVWGEELYFETTKIETNAQAGSRSRPASPLSSTSRISSRKIHKIQTVPRPIPREL